MTRTMHARLLRSLALLLAATFTPPAEAGLTDSPLPTFSTGRPAVLVADLPAVISNPGVETLVACTNLSTAVGDIGVEFFDDTGARANSIGLGNGASINVAIGRTVTFATGSTAILHEDVVVVPEAPVVASAYRTGRVVASHGSIRCMAWVVDRLHRVEDPAASPARTPVMSPVEMVVRSTTTSTSLPPTTTSTSRTTTTSSSTSTSTSSTTSTSRTTTTSSSTSTTTSTSLPGATTTTSTSHTTSTSSSTSTTTSTSLPGATTTTSTSTPTTTSSSTSSTTSSSSPGATTTSTTLPVPVCAPTPRSGCRAPRFAGRGKLMIRDYPTDSVDQLSWKWLAGSATTKDEFGTPGSTTSYTLCVYTGGALTYQTGIPAGGTCGTKACWSENTTGYKWLNKTSPAVQKVSFKAGVDGAAKIQVKGKGAGVAPPPPPLSLPTSVQLISSLAGGPCWETVFSFPTRNQAGLFNGKSD